VGKQDKIATAKLTVNERFYHHKLRIMSENYLHHKMKFWRDCGIALQNFVLISFEVILFHITQKKSSGVDNWYLDEFFEEFISSRRYPTKADDTHLTVMIFI
jgi:hypothetical protein